MLKAQLENPGIGNYNVERGDVVDGETLDRLGGIGIGGTLNLDEDNLAAFGLGEIIQGLGARGGRVTDGANYGDIRP